MATKNYFATICFVGVMCSLVSSGSWAVMDDDTGRFRCLAILSSTEVQESGLADLLMVQMQELGGVELVERDMLQKVLDEIALSKMLGADQSGNRRKAGTILKADILVLLSLEGNKVGKKKQKNIRIVISDCSNGARLRIGGVPFNNSKLEETSDDLAGIVSDTVDRFSDGVKQIIGVAHFISRSLTHDYDRFQASYAYLLGNALSTSPGVAVIEIEEAKSIRHENELTGALKSGRVVPVFVEGEFIADDPVPGNRAKLNMIIRISDSTGLVKQIDRDDLSMDKVASFITDDVAQEILKFSVFPSVEKIDEEKQFLVLIRRADEFARQGGWEHSTGLREAAILLKPKSVEQRLNLIYEYRRGRSEPEQPPPGFKREPGNEIYVQMCRNRAVRWYLNLEHLEYLIFNKMINRKKARELAEGILHDVYLYLSSSINPQLHDTELRKKDFLRGTYPKILQLKPSTSNVYRQQEEYLQWYRVLIKEVLIRHGDNYLNKEDLFFIFDLHENVVPEGMGPSYKFTNFLERNSRFAKGRNSSSFSQEEFLDFVTLLSKSKKTLSSLYGRYTLLSHEYYQIKKTGKVMVDMIEKADNLMKSYEETEFLLCSKSYWKDNRLYDCIEELRLKIRSGAPRVIFYKNYLHRQKPLPPTKGRLIFKKIPLQVKDLSGNTHQMYKKRWHELGGWASVRNILNCGNSLDVMWNRGVVLFMKEKGLLEEVLADKEPVFDDIKWDGRNVWVATRNEGIWLLDTSGKITAKIHSGEGLPPANSAVMLHLLEPGKMFVVGSFRPHKRAWCAIVEFKNGKTSVNIFHRATRTPTADYDRELGDNIHLVFKPIWIHEYNTTEKNNRILLVGRNAPSLSARQHPLSINLTTLEVSVFPRSFGYVDHFFSHFYSSRNGALFEAEGFQVTRWPAIGTSGPDASLWSIYEPHNNWDLRKLLEYNGVVYYLGSVWFRFDLNTLKAERLVDNLPEPYRSLSEFGVSAHYGILGWSWKHGFYQINITDEEHEIK